MNYDELNNAEKKYRQAKVIRIVLIILAWLLLIADFIISILKGLISSPKWLGLLLLMIPIIMIFPITNSYVSSKSRLLYSLLETYILKSLGLSDWKYTDINDSFVEVNSKKAVDNYDDIKFFKEYDDKLYEAAIIVRQKLDYEKLLMDFLSNNDFKGYSLYPNIVSRIQKNLRNTDAYKILVEYTSPTGRSHAERLISVYNVRVQQLLSDKSLLMTKSEYNKYVKEQNRELIEQKHRLYYEKVNSIIDTANEQKKRFVIKSDEEELDKLIATLFDRTVNSINKIKSLDSEEWDLIDKILLFTTQDVNVLITRNRRITDYYDSPDFKKLKETCDNLMSTQREFNEYIDEKVKSISNLFGSNIIRNETTHEDVYEYIHPYNKSITPFTAEVSANVFGSAENNPLDYVVKHFYPNKDRYPEQIQKLHLLIEELETLKDAKLIIENYKKDIQQYLTEVPSYVIEDDESGFYSRLGFATVDEKTLTVEYKFSYTSNGGKAQRSFTIPMTEETIVKLIELLESKLTMTAFSKEQRALMTSKLRQQIKERDNYTCQICGNSTHSEPNLLLEIDHILPVAKGGCTTESNLQTLCWKCNRHKSSKII